MTQEQKDIWIMPDSICNIGNQHTILEENNHEKLFNNFLYYLYTHFVRPH